MEKLTQNELKKFNGGRSFSEFVDRCTEIAGEKIEEAGRHWGSGLRVYIEDVGENGHL